MEKSVRNVCLCELSFPLVYCKVTHSGLEAVAIQLVLLVGKKNWTQERREWDKQESAGTTASLYLMPKFA